MTFLTDFADQAVVLPVVVAVALVLIAYGWWRAALAWLGMIGVTFGVMLVLKLGFLACRPVFGPWSIHSPSGHAAAAAVVAGGLAALLTGRRLAALPLSALSGAVIGLSRVVLGFHSVPEVLLGATVGVAGTACLPRFTGPPPPRLMASMLLAAAAVAIMLHGARLPAESVIWKFAIGALDFVPACRAVPGPL